ncbi:MAG: sodium-dependent bicarbonate transport family permease [Planctomycetia bacterium]
MDPLLVASNLLNPPVLFFALGALAHFVRSDLEIPQPLPKFLSLYLLLAIGFKGGGELHESGLGGSVLATLGAAIGMAAFVPLWTWFVLRRRLDPANAAAVAATYGSISAVTFIAASAFLSKLGVTSSGYMVAAMALMESPAIIIGIALARRAGGSSPRTSGERGDEGWSHLLRDSFANGSVLVLSGALVIGWATGSSGKEALAPFTDGIFRGMLCLLPLDMGIVSARRVGSLRSLGAFPLAFAVVVPLVNATLGMCVAGWLDLGQGDALLFTVLCASASYIAVPAALRLALPEANPGLYVTMALALTFPFNIVVGLPLYMGAIQRIWT